MLGADYSAAVNTFPSPDVPVVVPLAGYAAQSPAHHINKGSASHIAAVVAQVVGHNDSRGENILVEGLVPQVGGYWH